jgi:polyribonucleotide nucleotidyltransferase
MISDIPFAGPVAAVRMGLIDDQFVVNPSMPQVETESQLDIVVSGMAANVVMVEGEAHQVPEEKVLEAIRLAHEAMQPILQMQHEMAAEIGKPKREITVEQMPPESVEEIRSALGNRLWEALYHSDKQERDNALNALREEVLLNFGQGADPEENLVKTRRARTIFDKLVKEELRQAILVRNKRPDGRASDEIRTLSAEVGIIPRGHGSALFTRGQTQALSTTTLGPPGDEQTIDDLGIREAKRYLHHYNFPPFSTGEARPIRGPRRRDIGHGALSERALVAVLPDEDTFPYTVRVVSEILSSNGSSSMASICASSLSLMDAGVPIAAPVAGVGVGLISGEDGHYSLLTDIQGLEDALGDMDLKMAGTEKGVTALQMDLKVHGLPTHVLAEAFAQSRKARLQIIEMMKSVLGQPRSDLSPFAPRIVKVRIDPEKIGAVIGPGGKTIRSIIESSGAEIDVEDDGSIFITTPDAAGAHTAIRMIEQLTRDPKVGDIFLGKVVRIMPYGAFVNILPNRDGMVHISELDDHRVGQVEDVVQLGDEVNVMVTDVDRDGKISLSRRAVLTGEMPEKAAARKRPSRPRRRDHDRRPRPTRSD